MLKPFSFYFMFSLSLIFSSSNINQASANISETLVSGSFYEVHSEHSKDITKPQNLILTNPVIDEANLLTAQEEQQLSQRLRSIYEQGIAQPAIVIVPTTGDKDTFDYALDIAERWKLGDKDIDNGLLVLVSVEDKKIFILTGYGIEANLPDSVVGRIIRHDIKPYFKNGEFFTGLSTGFDTIEQKLGSNSRIDNSAPSLNKQSSNKTKDNSEETNSGFMMIFFMFLLFGNIATAILGRVIGSTVLTGIFFKIALSFGASIFIAIPLSAFLWLYLMARSSSKNRNSAVILPSGNSYSNYDFDSSYTNSDSFDSYNGDGGDFGGGGAGGSW